MGLLNATHATATTNLIVGDNFFNSASVTISVNDAVESNRVGLSLHSNTHRGAPTRAGEKFRFSYSASVGVG